MILIGEIIAALLTVMVFSYLAGNNPLYRLAQHIFVGVSIGYATLLLVGNVLIPQLTSFSGQSGLGGWLFGLPLIFGLVLLFRLFRPAATEGGAGIRMLVMLSTIVLNIAVSTAAALAIGGALTGTLVPQIAGTMRPLTPNLDGLNNLLVVLGVGLSLYYFQFNVRTAGTRSALGTVAARAGRWFIVIALGATLGSLSVSFVGALVDRVAFLFTLHLPSG
ncbi:MAG TPA: hypothetical protein VKY74_01715 [Chloroflexia bacterium]|nr:hypothetical protein [Chloroflexia bacterium]